jgi:hypothetical protein
VRATAQSTSCALEARGAASSEAARNAPGYLFDFLLFVVLFAPLFAPFLAPFFFAGIVSALRNVVGGAACARNH